MKKGDKILIIIILALSIFMMYIVNKAPKLSDSAYVSVQVEGKEVKKINFDKSLIGKTYRIETDHGYNIIEIGDKSVRVIEADCKDKIDVKQGWISKPGETLVCLPHKLVIEIMSESEISDVDHINY